MLNAFLSYSTDNDLMEIADLKKVSNSSSAIIKKMIEKGIFLESYVQVDRIQSAKKLQIKKIDLNNNQKNAFHQIVDSLQYYVLCNI